MDVLNFAAEIIKALAWPTALVLIALMFRKPVIELLPFLRRLKYKEIELEFSKELAQLKSDASASEFANNKKSEPTSVSAANSRLLNLASVSTSAAILEAWAELESVSIAVVSAMWNQPSTDVFRDYSRLGDYLLQCKIINKNQLVIFNKLRELRNKAAHAVDLNLSETEARTYVELASTLAAHIRDK